MQVPPPLTAGHSDSPPIDPTPHAHANIVVVDDEPLSAAGLAAFLGAAGYQRVTRLKGRECSVQALRDERPDLLLLERSLNQADAFDLLRSMQADRVLRQVPVIMLSAQDDLTSRLRALELGAAEYLVKPIDASELRLRLRLLLAAKLNRDKVAHTDHLTGLPNRESLRWRLDWSLKHALRHGTAGAVLNIGLERFRQVNDALGPAGGDELLHAVSRRLVGGLRDGDSVAHDQGSRNEVSLSRGSGNEFMVLLPVLERAEDAAVVARRMVERMAEPFVVAGHELFVSCRIGIAVFPGDSADKETVLKQAGVAMHHALPAGQDGDEGFRFYSEDLNAGALRRIGIERELHIALAGNQLRLHYQAQVDVASGQLCGAEALVRWQHPRRGLIGPGEFIEVAEDAGLIGRLGEWVLREALRQVAEWRRAGLHLPQVSVNVASKQLRRAGLAECVRDALESSGLEGQALCLELTESAIIDSGPQVTETLKAIKKLGVQLALDDFGTGYSSLSHLRRFSIDEVKIDRSFVSNCDSDANSASLTAAIVAMAHQLKLRVVAEGVETPLELAFIRANGAEAFQGYLFARPLPPAEFSALLTRATCTMPKEQALAALVEVASA